MPPAVGLPRGTLPGVPRFVRDGTVLPGGSVDQILGIAAGADAIITQLTLPDEEARAFASQRPFSAAAARLNDRASRYPSGCYGFRRRFRLDMPPSPSRS